MDSNYIAQLQRGKEMKGGRNIGEKTARKIEASIGYKLFSLDGLSANDEIREDNAFYNKEILANTEPARFFPGMVPEISYVQAGEFSEAIDLFEPGYAEKWHPRVKGGEHVFALRVAGDSMTAPTGVSFPEGMLIHIDPDKRQPENGQYVVARLKGHDSVTFKQFKIGESKPYLKPLNPQYQPIFDEFVVIGVLVFAGWEF